MNQTVTTQEQELIRKGQNAYRRERMQDPVKAKKQADYIREWKRKHPEKQAEYQKRFWLKKAEQYKQTDKTGEE